MVRPGSMMLLVLVALAPCAVLAAGTADPQAISAELESMYDADQKDRTFDSPPTPADWQEIQKRDAARLARVKEIAASGPLASAADINHAAMVLQHGPTDDDVLTARVLATVAGSKGHEKAPWLAAAALDRFLHRTGRAQIFGTQRHVVTGEWTLEPHDRSMSESIREEYGLKPRR